MEPQEICLVANGMAHADGAGANGHSVNIRGLPIWEGKEPVYCPFNPYMGYEHGSDSDLGQRIVVPGMGWPKATQTAPATSLTYV